VPAYIQQSSESQDLSEYQQKPLSLLYLKKARKETDFFRQNIV